MISYDTWHKWHDLEKEDWGEPYLIIQALKKDWDFPEGKIQNVSGSFLTESCDRKTRDL